MSDSENRIQMAVDYGEEVRNRPDNIFSAVSWRPYRGTQDQVGTLSVLDGKIDTEDIEWMQSTFDQFEIRPGPVDELRVVVYE